MIQGSSVSVRTSARPLKACCSSSAAANPNTNCRMTEPNTQTTEFHSVSQNGVLNEADVVAEPDEAVVLRLVQHVGVQAHLDREYDRHDDGREHAQRGRNEVGIA